MKVDIHLKTERELSLVTIIFTDKEGNSKSPTLPAKTIPVEKWRNELLLRKTSDFSEVYIIVEYNQYTIMRKKVIHGSNNETSDGKRYKISVSRRSIKICKCLQNGSNNIYRKTETINKFLKK
jgi:hypothetical protein